jgi:hypothetical protein
VSPNLPSSPRVFTPASRCMCEVGILPNGSNMFCLRNNSLAADLLRHQAQPVDGGLVTNTTIVAETTPSRLQGAGRLPSLAGRLWTLYAAKSVAEEKPSKASASSAVGAVYDWSIMLP